MKTEDSDLEQKIKKEVLEEIEETGWSKKQYLNDITKTAINLTYSKTRQALEKELELKQKSFVTDSDSSKQAIEQARKEEEIKWKFRMEDIQHEWNIRLKEEREKCEKIMDNMVKTTDEIIVRTRKETATEIFKEIYSLLTHSMNPKDENFWKHWEELKGRWLK